jgi:hypothetical protein
MAGFFDVAGATEVPYIESFAAHPRTNKKLSNVGSSARCANCIATAWPCEALPLREDSYRCLRKRSGLFTSTDSRNDCRIIENVFGVTADEVPGECSFACGPRDALQYDGGYARAYRDEVSHPPNLYFKGLERLSRYIPSSGADA